MWSVLQHLLPLSQQTRKGVSACRFMCLFRLLAWTLEYLHLLHINGFVSLCMRTCVFNWLILRHLYPQISQRNGFSPLCIIMCLFFSLARMNELSHSSQVYLLRFDLPAVWFVKTWYFKSCCCLYEESHWLHLKGFKPVCDIKCLFKQPFFANVFSQCLQMKFFLWLMNASPWTPVKVPLLKASSSLFLSCFHEEILSSFTTPSPTNLSMPSVFSFSCLLLALLSKPSSGTTSSSLLGMPKLSRSSLATSTRLLDIDAFTFTLGGGAWSFEIQRQSWPCSSSRFSSSRSSLSGDQPSRPDCAMSSFSSSMHYWLRGSLDKKSAKNWQK